MSWKESTKMSQKEDFIKKALAGGVPFNRLCRSFGISTVTGYKWLDRYKKKGLEGLEELSRAPRYSPNRTPRFIEEMVLKIREQHPAWGARKIKAYLERQSDISLPAPSTITEILKRHQKIDRLESLKRQAFSRFEHVAANKLWQMDFKGRFKLENRQTCYPLTIIDDHSRFSLCIQSCANEQYLSTRKQVERVFGQYGLPEQINTDNGNPWGNQFCTRYTKFSIWLMRLGIKVSHSRPRHPQTNGKNERFHRTLKKEVLLGKVYADFDKMQLAFDAWRECYNHERPHEGIGMQVPADRYSPSMKRMPKKLPEIEYSADSILRKVRGNGYMNYAGGEYQIGEAFAGYPIEIRHDQVDEKKIKIYFGINKIYTFRIN